MIPRFRRRLTRVLCNFHGTFRLLLAYLIEGT